MCDFNSTVDINDPDLYILGIVREVFTVMQAVGLCIEIIFVFVMIRNWYMKSIFLMSSFFYLLTLKTVNDTIYIIYTLILSYWAEQVKDFNDVFGTPFFISSLEIDVFSQFAIAVNRYTAMMMPLKQERVSSSI